MNNLMNDVKAFHEKFDMPQPTGPRFPEDELLVLKMTHLEEELNEVLQAIEDDQIVDVFDGLIDLVYVALGTAYAFGLPFQKGWDRVHAANMCKVRALKASDSKRGSVYDIVKPAGWIPPNLEDLV